MIDVPAGGGVGHWTVRALLLSDTDVRRSAVFVLVRFVSVCQPKVSTCPFGMLTCVSSASLETPLAFWKLCQVSEYE